MIRYAYQGPVMVFDQCVNDNWKAETMAVSKAKALSNLKYRWKKENNRVSNCVVTLPGKLVAVE